MNYEHMVELRVRYDECDPMGFVHHANYMKYFEIARTDRDGVVTAEELKSLWSNR